MSVLYQLSIQTYDRTSGSLHPAYRCLVSASGAGPGLGSLTVVPANPAGAISQGTW